MEAIFNPACPDLPDITHHSYGLADMLKSGFRSEFKYLATPTSVPDGCGLFIFILQSVYEFSTSAS